MNWSIVSLEGNSNQAASRTGGQVCRLRRSTNIVGFGMPLYNERYPIRKMLDACRSQLGYSEGPNNHTSFGVEYGEDHVAWCAIFQSVMGKHAFGTYDVVGKYDYTPDFADHFRKLGRWSSLPKVGSLAFIYSHDLGRIGHVALVEDTDYVPSWYKKPVKAGDRSAAAGIVRGWLDMSSHGAFTTLAADRLEARLTHYGMWPSKAAGEDVARAIGERP